MRRAGWPRALLRAALLFVAINVAAAVVIRARALLPNRLRPMGAVAGRIGLERLSAAYPEMSRRDLARFLAERAAANRLEYEAFTEFRQRPVRGEFLNVSEKGYRFVEDQGPWPPSPDAFNVFVFGGSTAFGDGLPDRASLPSALQRALPAVRGRNVRVYNFARPGYYSSQERILFQQLLLTRVRIDAAVFVDGVNEIRPVETPDAPRWEAGATGRLASLVDESNRHETRHALALLARSLPITRLALEAIERKTPVSTVPLPGPNGVAERWLMNVNLTSAVARRLSVPLLFVWQPMPLYRYDAGQHVLGAEGVASLAPIASVYARLRRMLGEVPRGDVLWLADVQEGRRENLYVDEVHYTARFSRELAEAIAGRLLADLKSEKNEPALERRDLAPD